MLQMAFLAEGMMAETRVSAILPALVNVYEKYSFMSYFRHAGVADGHKTRAFKSLIYIFLLWVYR